MVAIRITIGDKNSCAICYDEDYVKVWNISLGKLKTTLEYGRRKVVNLVSLKDGRILIVKFKKDNRVVLVDVDSNYEKTLYEGDEDVKL